MGRVDPWSLFVYLWLNKENPANPGQYFCWYCGKPTTETRRVYYCSDECYWLCMKMLSWPWLRRDVYERDGGCCVNCGVNLKDPYECHHIISVTDINHIASVLTRAWGYVEEDDKGEYVFTEREMRVWSKLYTALFMDMNNLVTLCHECHKDKDILKQVEERFLGQVDRWWLQAPWVSPPPPSPQKSLEEWMEITE